MLKRMIASWRGTRASMARMEARLANMDAHLEKLSSLPESVLASRLQQAPNYPHIGHLEMIAMYLERLELMTALSHPRFNSPLRLERFGHKTSSQFDEDGIIAEIFRRIGEKSRVFVEIAAGNGKENCTALLLTQGWSGLWVECDEPNVRSINETWPDQIARGQLKVSSQFIEPENVDDVITQSGVGNDVDLLVMDIDGNDYHVLEALKLKPRVICLETFSMVPPPVRWVMPRIREFVPWHGQPTGASLQSFEDLLTPRGYSLVGSSIVGVNAFFVRSDLVEGKFEAPFTAYNHYNSPRYWYPARSVLSTVWNGPADGKAPPLPPKK